jgi:hypothetical protein
MLENKLLGECVFDKINDIQLGLLKMYGELDCLLLIKLDHKYFNDVENEYIDLEFDFLW